MSGIRFDKDFSGKDYHDSRKELIEEFDSIVRELPRYTLPFPGKKSKIPIEVSKAQNSYDAFLMLGGKPDKTREAAYNFLEKIDVSKDIHKRIIGPDILKKEKRNQLKKIISTLSIKK